MGVIRKKLAYHPPSNIISSKEDLFKIIETVREYMLHVMLESGEQVYEMFRGQGRDCWKLLPTISRKLDNPNQAEEIEKKIITDFDFEMERKGYSKSLQKSFLDSAFHTEWLLLQQSQHYRIPTRLIDWTINWEVALFFAVSNPSDDYYDGQFWIYVVPPGKLITDNTDLHYLDLDPFTFDLTIFLNSSGYLDNGYLDKIAERRKFRQNGRFCIQPYRNIFTPLEEQDEHKPNLIKIIIPKELKKIIRENLKKRNYTTESLYVNDDKTINEIVKNLRQQYGV